jgi:DNA-binding MarR family transcriptional regulator
MQEKGSSLGTAEPVSPGAAEPVHDEPPRAKPVHVELVRNEPAQEEAIGEIESALHSLSRSLRQVRLHDFLLAEARADVDRAGMALLYVLHVDGTSLRLTDLAEQLHIDAPAVTRKAQQLERSGLVSRTRDAEDGRATRLQLTPAGRRTINRILAARRAWLTGLLSGWPESEQAEFARLLRQFTSDVDRHLGGLDA